MERDITITLPESLYSQMREWAQATRRPMADLLLDAALQVLPQAHINPNRSIMQQEITAFNAMKGELLTRYAGEFVAMEDGRVVDHDVDQLALAARVGEQHAAAVVLIKQVLPDSPTVLHYRSSPNDQDNMRVFSYAYSSHYQPAAPVAEIEITGTGSRAADVLNRLVVSLNGPANIAEIAE